MTHGHPPPPPLHSMHANVSLISRVYVILNTSHIKGVLAGTLVTGLRPSFLCSIAQRAHGIKGLFSK